MWCGAFKCLRNQYRIGAVVIRSQIDAVRTAEECGELHAGAVAFPAEEMERAAFVVGAIGRAFVARILAVPIKRNAWIPRVLERFANKIGGRLLFVAKAANEERNFLLSRFGIKLSLGIEATRISVLPPERVVGGNFGICVSWFHNAEKVAQRARVRKNYFRTTCDFICGVPFGNARKGLDKTSRQRVNAGG